jgi:hypothetical protein
VILCRTLELGQVRCLSLEHLLEHLSGIGTVADEGVIEERAEGEIPVPCQAGLHDSFLIESVRVHEVGYRWRKLSEHDA